MFLDKLTADMPFPVEAIQVDGGSEFMAEFEAECQRRKLKLYVVGPEEWRFRLQAKLTNGGVLELRIV
jgi:hypothetical protein